VLSAAIGLIARARAGAAPGVAEIPVVFEHETNAAVTAAQRG
jgi:hypothetical protein